jgi:type II secretory pathway pseudopilin PulG
MGDKRTRLRWFLAVLAMVVILVVTMVMSGASHFRQQGKRARTQAQLNVIYSATTNFVGIFGRWPVDMKALSFNPSNIIFVSPVAPWSDGWGRPFIYTPPGGTNGAGVILSLGRDGMPGGVGYDADLQVKLP